MSKKDEKTDWMKILEPIAIPRRAGSEEEKKVRDHIVKEWESFGSESEDGSVKVNKLDVIFSKDTPKVVSGFFILGFVLILLWNLLSLYIFREPPHIYITCFFSVLIIFSLMAGSRWNSIVEVLYRRKTANMIKTANIEAVIDRKAQKTIIFTAHYDSKSQSIGFLPRLFMAGFCYGSALFIAMYSILYSVYLINIMKKLPPAQELIIHRLNSAIVLLGFLIILVLALFYFIGSGNKSPGAVDNGSGVAVLTCLLKHFSENPPDDVNLRFVATAAEEDGLIGAVKYIEKMESVLDKGNTCFVNLDSVGAKGKLLIIDRYGIPPVSTSKAVSAKILKTANEFGIPAKRVYSPMGVGYDSIPIAYKGYESVTLAHCGFDKALWSIHSGGDSLANIDPDALQNTYEVCKSYVFSTQRSQRGKDSR
ncbi:MAG: M28 family peptidase [Candidatus Eremiobacteraeota bacterium]|nr:M28 family peptidase [Candidatus Eremiobacteraeota bacterium]